MAMLIVENLITEDRGSVCLVLIVIVRQTGFCFRPIITDKYFTFGINGLRLIPPVMLMNWFTDMEEGFGSVSLGEAVQKSRPKEKIIATGSENWGLQCEAFGSTWNGHFQTITQCSSSCLYSPITHKTDTGIAGCISVSRKKVMSWEEVLRRVGLASAKSWKLCPML